MAASLLRLACIVAPLLAAVEGSSAEGGTCPASGSEVSNDPLLPFLVQKQGIRQQLHGKITEDLSDLHEEADAVARNPCDPTFSGFHCVSDGALGACRTASLTGGEEGKEFERIDATSAAECANLCEGRGDCAGFEAAASGEHCEIWFSAPQKTSGAAGWLCRVKDADNCGSDLSFSGFACIAGYEKGGCRLASGNTFGDEGIDYDLAAAVSAQDCSAQCLARADCLAFESSATGDRCELWRTPPVTSSGTAGYVCRMKASSPAAHAGTVTSVPSTGCCAPGSRIQVSGRQLLVDGKPLHLKGVNWSPVKKGWSTPWGLDFAGTVETDSKMMKDAGINVVRLYQELSDRAVLDRLWARGIYVMPTVYGWGGDTTGVVVDRVKAVKDHPAILMWVVGNEWNYNGLYTGLTHDATIARLAEVVDLIRQTDRDHPVTTIYGELPSQATLSALSKVDIWGINAYRGKTLGDLFTRWASSSGKPMYLGEYGADAWDATIPAEHQQAQADATTVLTEEIVQNSAVNGGSCLGGLLFEFNDEWWKDWSGSAWAHDVGGIAPGGGPHPDGVFNEEWWGLVDIDRTPRQAYYAYQKVASPER